MVRKNKKSKRLLFSCLVIFITIGFGLSIVCLEMIRRSLVSVVSHPFVIKSLSIKFNDVHDAAIKQKIISVIQRKTNNANLLFFDKEKFYKDIRAEFPIVEKLGIKSLVFGGFEFCIQGVRPLHLINDSYVLAHNKKLYEKVYFTDWLGDKKSINVVFNDFSEEYLASIYSLFLQISPQIFEKFIITYKSSSCIELRPRQECEYRLVYANAASIIDDFLFDAIPDVIHDMYRRGILIVKKRKLKNNLLVDVRFDKRIIVKVLGESKRGRVG